LALAASSFNSSVFANNSSPTARTFCCRLKPVAFTLPHRRTLHDCHTFSKNCNGDSSANHSDSTTLCASSDDISTHIQYPERSGMVSTATSAMTPQREPPRPPPPAVVEAEQQWIFTEEELLLAPSITDGMPAEEERTLRRKGVNFILQVGMMLKLPQTTLSTAAVFFNRYLMRMSLKPRPGYKPLHQYVSLRLELSLPVSDSSSKSPRQHCS
jgi:hypothetical protein